MPRRYLPAAGATLAAALAFAHLTPVLAQSSDDKAPPPAAAAEAPAPANAAAAPPPAAPQVDPLVAQVRDLAAAGAKGKGASADRSALAEFYAGRTALVWVTADGLTPRAQHAMAEIAKADDWGLEARAFELPQVGDKSQPALADAEIKISLAVLKYARFARGGRLDPTQLSRNFDQRPTLRDPKAVMEAVAATDTPGNYLRDLHPKHVQFDRLRQALLKVRANTGSQPEVKAEAAIVLPDGPALKAGMDHPNVALLRQRLKVRTSAGTEQFFDQDVLDAVKAFQQKNGIQPSGIVSSRTREALNKASGGAARPVASSPAAEAQRIVINMERWRWMP
jgi:murein L,D-transpeptidase YcbB/YkuD